MSAVTTVRNRPLRVSTFERNLPTVALEVLGRGAAGIQKGVHFSRPLGSDHQGEQLVRGEVDLALTVLDNAVEWQGRGIPIRVAGVIDLGVGHELVAKGPGSLQELAGARIGVDSATNGLVTLMSRALHDAGLASDRYSVVEVGGVGQRAEALAAGALDACLLMGVPLALALATGSRSLMRLRDVFPAYPAPVAVATVATLAERGEDVQALVQSLRSVTLRALGCRLDLGPVAETLGVDLEVAERWLEAERDRISRVVESDAEAQNVIEAALWATRGPLHAFQHGGALDLDALCSGSMTRSQPDPGEGPQRPIQYTAHGLNGRDP